MWEDVDLSGSWGRKRGSSGLNISIATKGNRNPGLIGKGLNTDKHVLLGLSLLIYKMSTLVFKNITNSCWRPMFVE